MAVGDIGAVLDTEALNAAARFCYNMLRLGSTQNFVYCESASLYLQTHTVSTAGIVTADIDTWQVGNQGDSPGSVIFHVHGTVYGIIYTNLAAGDHGVLTVNIADDGTITKAVIADVTDIGPHTCLEAPLQVYDSGTAIIYAYNGSYNGTIHTFSISYDGLTISEVDTEVLAASSYAGCMIELSPNYFVVALTLAGTAVAKLYTLNITNAGAITLVSSTNFSDNANNVAISGIRLNPGYFAFFYKDTTAVKSIVRTIAISNAGVIGSVIDTDNAVFPADADFNLYFGRVLNLGNNVYLVGYDSNSHHYVSSIGISGLGVIGTIVDTIDIGLINAGGAQYQVLKIASGVYGSMYKYSTYPYLQTFEVTEGVTTKSDDGRVGSIRHIYRPGVYRAELTLGGYEVQKVLPEEYVDVTVDEAVIESIKKDSDIKFRPGPMSAGRRPLTPYVPQGAAWQNEFTVTSKSTRPKWETNIIRLPKSTVPEVIKAIQSDVETNSGAGSDAGISEEDILYPGGK